MLHPNTDASATPVEYFEVETVRDCALQCELLSSECVGFGVVDQNSAFDCYIYMDGLDSLNTGQDSYFYEKYACDEERKIDTVTPVTCDYF